MSKFLAEALQSLTPYTPGEQPQGGAFIKLNTNENPYFPSRYAVSKITEKTLDDLRLYSDPTSADLRGSIAAHYGVSAKNVAVGNGSDEILAFAFRAFAQNGACFPDITYGFYKVFAALFGAEAEEIPLNADFTVDIKKYFNKNKCVVLANPNAQTGIALPLSAIEEIVRSNPENVVVIDEAYVDFGGESAAELIGRYDNLLVVQTFSKSRSLAGARVGFALGCESLISDLERVKYSFNPYNVNRLSALLAGAAMEDKSYFSDSVEKIKRTREETARELKTMGFTVLSSSANFLMASCDRIGGGKLYEELKARGVLVRHFGDERIENFVRVSIGTPEQMRVFLQKTKEILDGKKG
ncbi:MAG: histidinol-phosphate transaminase [Bacillota bacterium]|nr:MAG: histidinol-phosphate transaminase [Bacillota bacterium]